MATQPKLDSPWLSAINADKWMSHFCRQVIMSIRPLIPPHNSHPDFSLTLTVTIRHGKVRVTPLPQHVKEEGWRDSSG